MPSTNMCCYLLVLPHVAIASNSCEPFIYIYIYNTVDVEFKNSSNFVLNFLAG